ncbi:bZIP transcription factor 27-like isoform X1 [Curcuma longa]|uniref:bZIP transcription factor 27-like isoform X1 n=1 Tax=Curcuma longa TaxID=136217 RepID=UPI003D9E8FE1
MYRWKRKWRKQMEELWKDMGLSITLHQDIPPAPLFCSFHHNVNSTTTTTTTTTLGGVLFQDLLAGVSMEPSPLVSLVADGAFSVLSGAGFESSKRQLPDPSVDSRERRKKRMIKNRESAARSRARKQAYTNELEKEVDRLLNENRMLKRQHELLRLEMAAQNLKTPCKRKLYRTLTAPF